jgi:pyrrolidone-carboxylate peptidase
MANIKPVDIPNQYKESAQEALQDVMDENPDTVIILSFWKDRGQFKIKTSMVPDRLMLIGAIEEAKAKVISDGYAS